MSIGTAVVVNRTGPFGAAAATMLAAHAQQVIEVGTGDEEATWAELARTPAGAAGEIDLIVHCPLGGADAATPATRALRSAWLAAKHSHTLMAQRCGGTLLTLLAAPDGAASPERAATLGGTRLLTQAALLDAMKAGLTQRSNRLVIHADVVGDAIVPVLAALCDARTSFMSGADIGLERARGSRGFSDRLDGRTILVTGATSGIGRATAVAIGRLGGHVVVGGRKPPLAEETAQLVREAGSDASVVSLDVTDAAAWRAAVDGILARHGALHGLVNNAGEARNSPIAMLSAADLDWLLDINLTGAQLGMECALAAMTAAGEGAIVNVASVAGIRAGFGGSAYGGSKAALIGATLHMAERVRDAGVRVSALQPGLIWSDSVADSMGDEAAQAFRRMIEPRTPLGRVGTPEEVAATIAFLLTDAAAGITAQAITVSGGLELAFP